MNRTIALAWGALCHLCFVLSVGAMAYELSTGMRAGLGPAQGAWAWAWDLGLLLAFPFSHSLLLTDRGRRALRRVLGPSLGGVLDTTRFAIAASLQLGGTFLLWAPLPGEVLVASGALGLASAALFGLGWLALAVSMAEAGLGVQTGALGWWAAFRGKRPSYPGLPSGGLHAACRHPIYLSFLVILVSGPCWSADRVLLAAVWGSYCLLGPKLKEARLAKRHGETWTAKAGRAWWVWRLG
ncbi:MAG: isoprenylcysteine carboxylmethyltransferase family protein [Alphaproteobacteria bacterium]|nr:isoprenylcysteine carboxylmethyltransferase family protein [Alphaproteobacteria bacterium]MCB9794960.1 isoprenylcysteine carboxylmethyltransferase family protein [Alphaproteobacteria bacterium]